MFVEIDFIQADRNVVNAGGFGKYQKAIEKERMNFRLADGKCQDDLIDIGGGGADEEIFSVDDAINDAGAVGILIEVNEIAGANGCPIFETLQQSSETAGNQFIAVLYEEEAVVEFDHASDHYDGTSIFEVRSIEVSTAGFGTGTSLSADLIDEKINGATTVKIIAPIPIAAAINI